MQGPLGCLFFTLKGKEKCKGVLEYKKIYTHQQQTGSNLCLSDMRTDNSVLRPVNMRPVRPGTSSIASPSTNTATVSAMHPILTPNPARVHHLPLLPPPRPHQDRQAAAARPTAGTAMAHVEVVTPPLAAGARFPCRCPGARLRRFLPLLGSHPRPAQAGH